MKMVLPCSIGRGIYQKKKVGMRMFLSVMTDELRVDVAEALPILKEWGLEYVDFRAGVKGGPVENLSEEELFELKKELDRYGFKVGAIQSSLCKVHLPDEEQLKAEREKLEKIIRACDILDCHLVRSFNCYQCYDPAKAGTLAHTPELLAQCVKMFEPMKRRALEAGLTLAFENCGQSMDDAIAFADAMDVPGWGIAFDVFSFWEMEPEAQGDAVSYLTRGINRALMIHVKALSALEAYHRRKVPWQRVLSAVSARSIDMPVTIETHTPKEGPYQPIECTKRTLDVIRECWPSAAPTSVEEALEIKPTFNRPYENDPVRFVVVGLGMGKNRARQIAETPGCKLYGVCDLNLEKAETVGKQFHVAYSDDINVFLQDPQVEVMYVVTPTGSHAEVAIKCLEAGKHVLTTKPLDVCTANCDKLVAFAKEKGLLLGIDFDARQNPVFLEEKAAVDSGYFGKILSCSTNLYVTRTQAYYDENGGWRGTWRMDGGAAMCNQGVHEVDKMQALLGMPKRVRATIHTQCHQIECEDIGQAEWEYADGKLVRFFATTNSPMGGWYNQTTIVGTEGMYIVTSGGPEGGHAWWGKNKEWSETPPIRVKREWSQASDKFAYALRMGTALDISGEIGIPSRKLLDAMYESAQNDSCWVDICE